MTKQERIKQLEAEIKALKVQVALLETRLAVPPYRWPPHGPFTLTVADSMHSRRFNN